MDVYTCDMLKEDLTIEHVFGTIVPAWYRIAFHDPLNQEIALERGEACRTCEHLNHFALSKKHGKKCGICGCPIIALVRSSDKSGCRGGKWKR
jgi:hypothetical protein